MGLQADSVQVTATRRGFVLGELLVAVFLLAVAISSVTALMYSVTRHPRTRAAVDCGEQAAALSPQCATPAKAVRTKASNAARLLVAGCATRSGASVQACNDSVLAGQGPDATTIRSRTDSASLELLPKKRKRATRPDLGFIR